MKAVCWNGARDVRVENVDPPKILNPRDAIVRVHKTAICGSDLHLYNGFIPLMQKGDIIGHEFIGEVVEVGNRVTAIKERDRVIVSAIISCGYCYFCRRELWSLCDNSNPNGAIAEEQYGFTSAAVFGYSHMYGGYAGGQAEFVRVPFADSTTMKVPEDLLDEQALFLTDIFPTGFMAAENCNIQTGETVAVWGCGPVGQFAIQSAFLLGAGRVIAVDSIPERLEMARTKGKAEVINYKEVDDLIEELKERTGGRGPDACIDAVGMEATGTTVDAVYNYAKQKARLETDRPHVLRQVIQACRKGGTVSIPGVYGGFIDKVPVGSAFMKGLTFKMGQTNMQKYMRPLLQRIQKHEIDPTFVITHRLRLDEAPRAYEIFAEKKDGCIKVVMKP